MRVYGTAVQQWYHTNRIAALCAQRVKRHAISDETFPHMI